MAKIAEKLKKGDKIYWIYEGENDKIYVDECEIIKISNTSISPINVLYKKVNSNDTFLISLHSIDYIHKRKDNSYIVIDFDLDTIKAVVNRLKGKIIERYTKKIGDIKLKMHKVIVDDYVLNLKYSKHEKQIDNSLMVRCPKCGHFFNEKNAKPLKKKDRRGIEEDKYYGYCPHCNGILSLAQLFSVKDIFDSFKDEYPKWKENLTDSTYSDIADWFASNHGYKQNEESEYPEQVREFVNCVWKEIYHIQLKK